MRFHRKIACIVAKDLLPWQRLNVTAFTISGISTLPGLIGEQCVDGSGQAYLPMIRQPITLYEATRGQIREVHRAALQSGVDLSICTEELFSTPHDDANRAAVRAVSADDLQLVGLALHGPERILDRLLKGLSLHA